MTDTLLLVDVLSNFSHGDGARLRASFCEHAPALEALIDTNRREHVPVVYANDHFGDWSADRADILRRAQGSGAFENAKRILPRPDEPLILKPRYSAFDQTPLGLLLSELGTRRILLAGAALEMCVAQTAIAAREHGYQVSVMVDACAVIDQTNAQVARDYLERVVGARLSTGRDPSGDGKDELATRGTSIGYSG
jgi:nicotinamidase-related amidase